MQKSIDFIKIL